jgi:hypothetical protein
MGPNMMPDVDLAFSTRQSSHRPRNYGRRTAVPPGRRSATVQRARGGLAERVGPLRGRELGNARSSTGRITAQARSATASPAVELARAY